LISYKSFFYSLFLVVFLLGCETSFPNNNIDPTSSSAIVDSDNDFIPDSIESYIGLDIDNSDVNNNGILDGLDTEGMYGDKFFDEQWYIYSQSKITNSSGISSIRGNDLELLNIYKKYMGLNRGDNIIIQVVDEGIYARHEDLTDNIDRKRSYDGLESDAISMPRSDQEHGTKVAGVIAARAFNGKGVRGIIPFAKIASSNWLLYGSYDILDRVWYSGYGSNEIAISNNSWGFDFNTDTIFEEYMKKGSSELRDGKGRLYIFPSGNQRVDNGNANLQYLLNNRFAIVVSSINYNNRVSSYSSKGANILTCAYSGESKDRTPTIGTTTIPHTSSNSGDNQTTWYDDISRSYTYDFDGTSAAVPMVSASLGLVLEACPSLTWRDIRYLIATTSKQIDKNNDSWITNSVGLTHSNDYGFGLINPSKMIEKCQDDYQSLPKLKTTKINKNIFIPISDDNLVNKFDINIIQDITIEWVELSIDIDHQYASDIKIDLISPSGTRSNLIDINDISGNSYKNSTTANWMNGGFRFSTASMIEESSRGLWKVEVYDTTTGDVGNIKSAQLNIYGH